MKLSFHGAKYEYQPHGAEVVEGEVGGVYRGSPWRVHRAMNRKQRRHSTTELTYRGVHYTR